MSKQVITVRGEDMLVREDTAKAYRGVYWALGSVAIIIAVTLAILFFAGFFQIASDPDTKQVPAAAERNTGE